MAAAAARQEQQKIRSELEEDTGGDRGFLLPPPVTIGLEKHGLRKAMEYRFEDKGNEVKVATTTRVCEPVAAPLSRNSVPAPLSRNSVPAPLSRNAIESHLWPKVCDSVKEDVGSMLSMVCTGLIERPRSSGSKPGETTASGSPLDVTSKGGDHWTFKCPYKDLAPQTETSVKSSLSASGPAEPPVCLICMQAADRSVADMMGCRDDDTAIRVTNLSENTSEHDLYNLFCPFGIINDFSLALDEKTGSGRQFGIVEFGQREDAEEAINWLNGYSYDGLTLQVEMSTTGQEACDFPPICPTCMGAVETSVHVTNLSEDTCERDLYNLFCPFGSIHRFYLVSVDKAVSGRQSGIVEFDQREDAEVAISWLNGYEYGNQNLQVKWATVAELSSATIY